MAPVYGWKQPSAAQNSNVLIKPSGGVFAEDINSRLKKSFLTTLCRRPTVGLSEVRRDGNDNLAVAKLIRKEFLNKKDTMEQSDFISHIHTCKSIFVSLHFKTSDYEATMESVHQQFLEDDQPENERARLDPDHWFEINRTNATLFSNLYLETVEGLEQLVPGRFFSTRMPRDIVDDLDERNDFIKKCQKNKLRVVFVLTEPFEFKKYSGMDELLEFYKQECHLIVYNRAIPDFQIPTSGDLVCNILDLVYHLSQGRNCLVHCTGGTGRTGMVLASIIQNLGVYDPVARTYVETTDQEIFLKNMPRAIDKRIVQEKPKLEKAIAAEHLIQVFFTHKGKIEKADTIELLEAYRQTFDLIDQDDSGTLEREEIDEGFAMRGAELTLSNLTDVLLGDGMLTTDKFAQLMCSEAKANRRDYDIGDEGEIHQE